MKASFFKRVAAYFIDIMFVTLIASIITSGFSTTKYEKIYKEYEDLTNKYATQEITIEEYNEEIRPLTYDLQEASITTTIVTVTMSIAYFIVFQCLNKGQTLGKKMLSLRVLEKGKEPSLKAIILRTFIINSIFSGLCSIIFVYTLNRNNYYQVYSIISWLEMSFIFISVLFILYRKDKLGLHDIIAHTEVIDERGR